MEEHSLRGPNRCLVLPGVGAAGGIVAGLVMTALVNPELFSKPWLWRVSCWGVFIGYAPGLAIAFTSRGWLASLIALAVSFPLVMAVDWILFDSVGLSRAAGFEMYLREMIEPNFLQVGTALLTVPATMIHAARLRTLRALLASALHLAVAIAVAGLASCNEGPRYFLPFLGFTGSLALGQIAGIELALRATRNRAMQSERTG